jgi:hypothetical protein
VTMAVLTSYAMTYESGKTRFANPNAAESKDAGAEGALEPVGGGAAGKENPFEAGSQDSNKTSSKDATKTTTTPPKSPPVAADKTAPATKTTPANPPAPTK